MSTRGEAWKLTFVAMDMYPASDGVLDSMTDASRMDRIDRPAWAIAY